MPGTEMLRRVMGCDDKGGRFVSRATEYKYGTYFIISKCLPFVQATVGYRLIGVLGYETGVVFHVVRLSLCRA